MNTILKYTRINFKRSDGLFQELLPDSLLPWARHLKPYILESFGSFGRIDYGSGHELSFALLLVCLSVLRFFPVDSEESSGPSSYPDEERAIALKVFPKYLRVVWRVQDVYKLEPAGSHGVWGLDDYHFLPYLWGSSQVRGGRRSYSAMWPSLMFFLLLDDPTLEPSSVLAPPPLPSTNLYNLCINRIHSIKSGGAFHEHSPQLYSVAMGVPPAVRTTSRDQDGKLTTKYVSGGWKKVNIGMMKMYVAEVLSKRVVVQHTPLGGILDWDEVESSNPQTTNVSASQVPVSLPAPTQFIPQSATSMPSTRMPSQSTMLPTRFPGAPPR